MADRDSTPQEEQYERELNKARDSSRKKSSNKPASQTESKQTMPQRIGSGKLGRFGRAAMLAGGIIMNVNPAAAEHVREKAIYDNRSNVNKKKNAEVMPAQQTQNPAEQAFGKNATISENTQPTTVNYNPNQAAEKQEAEQREEQNQIGEEKRQQEAQTIEQTKKQEESSEKEKQENAQKSEQAQKQKPEPGKGTEKLATAGQAAGKTAEIAGKGVEFAGKAAEVGGELLQKGGQAMTRAGAGLSETGVGAIVGVPLTLAGGATTAAGAGIKGIGKGTEAVGKGISKGGKAVAEVSGKAKKGIQEARNISQGSSQSNTPGKGIIRGMGNLGKKIISAAGSPEKMKNVAEQTEVGAGVSYMNLRRKFQAAKKLAEGDVAGMVGDAVNKVAQRGSARALSWAWIAVIPTCGLSLLYINFHFIAHYVASSEKFCKFGDEWAIKKMASGSGEGNPLEEVNQMIEKFEIFGMFVLDAVVIFLIVLIKIQMDLSACLANNPVNTVFDPDSCYTSTKQ
jgi:hypothetical protein